jgi:SoxA/TsdA, cytochrome c domain
MMNPRTMKVAAVLVGCVAAASAVYLIAGNRGDRAYAQALATHQLPQSHDGNVVVQLCDGSTTAEVPGLKPGQQMTHARAVEFTRGLMAEWQRKHPDRPWVMAQADTGSAAPAAAQPAEAGAKGSENIAGPSAVAPTELKSQQGDTYASFHERDFKIWKAETDAFVEKGNQTFHSAQALGSTIGVSCDMCHPNAANTHPETYPKYQVQLQRVALLRDMINWCIENPVKGVTLSPDDPRMRALEAYILAQRNGVPLAHGKH